MPSSFDADTGVASSVDLAFSKKHDMHLYVGNKETGKLIPDGETGDIYVRGRGVVKGYFNNPEASKAFDYHLEGVEGKFYMTGDLGFIRDGKLYLTGRSKVFLSIILMTFTYFKYN